MDNNHFKYMDSLFLDEFKLLEELDICSKDELKVVEKENATILTYKVSGNQKLAGVIDENGVYVNISSFDALSPVDSRGGPYILDTKQEHIHETVVYFGRFWKHWGHFLMDMVSRLWYVVENNKNVKIVYDSADKIDGVYMEFLSLLGIKQEQLIWINKPTRFSKVIIPECSHKPGISCNIKFKKIFDLAAENALLKLREKDTYAGKSIYFTRRMLNLKISLEVGEKDIEKLFKDNGYLVIAPERFPLAEQIAMVRQADKIACVAGTLPHNMIFSKDGAELIVIRKTNKPNYRQMSVNKTRELKVTNIDAHISLYAVGPAGPFILDINENVRKFFMDKYGKCNYSKIGQWFKRKIRLFWYIPVYIMRNRGMNRQIPIFDGKVFSTAPTAKKELFKFYLKRI